MRRIHDLSFEELCALTDDQVRTFVEIEVAEQGIMPELPPQPVELADLGIRRTVEVFLVDGVLFPSESDAVAFAAMPHGTEEYQWNIGSEYKWYSPSAASSPRKVSLYDENDVLRVKSALVEQNTRDTAYKEARRRYGEFVRKTADVSAKVWCIVSAAREMARRYELARQTYARYLELADGDTATAQRFFANAYKDDQEIMDASERITGVALYAPTEAQE